MLPHNNNYSSHQDLPGNYTFDLKVNVDFNNGKVNLGVPSPPPPFVKKTAVPVVYPDQVFANPQSPHQSGYTAPYQPNQPIFHQVPQMWQPTPNYMRNQPYTHSAYNPQQIEQSYIMRYSDNQKPKSANDTYPDTSFSVGIQKSLDAVQCVICDKPISREHFHNHIEEHKGRKRDYTKKQVRPAQENGGSFSVRNQNSFENAANLYNQNPSRASHSHQIVEKSLSKVEQNKNFSRSRQIQDTHSRIVYAPRDPSQIVSAGNQSQFTYSHSSGYANNNMMPQHSRQSQKIGKPVNLSKGLISPQNSQLNYPQNQNDRVSKVSSMNLLTSQVSKRQDSRSLSQNKQPIQSYYQQNSRSSSVSRGNKFQNNLNQSNNNYFNLDRTQSRVIRPHQKKKQPSFQDIQQSVIHRINDVSRDYSILQLKKQLNIEQIQQQESSDDEGAYLSMRGNPPSNVYQNFSRSKHSVGMTSSSNMTDKLTRSKLPVNYLARQQFIVNSMLTRSCYKSRQSNWR